MILKENKKTGKWEARDEKTGEVLCSGTSKYYVTWKLKQNGGKKVGKRGRRPKSDEKPVKKTKAVAKKVAPKKVTKKAPKAKKVIQKPIRTKKAGPVLSADPVVNDVRKLRVKAGIDDKPIVSQVVVGKPMTEDKTETVTAKNMPFTVNISRHVTFNDKQEWLGNISYRRGEGLATETLSWNSGYKSSRDAVIEQAKKFAAIMGAEIIIK